MKTLPGLPALDGWLGRLSFAWLIPLAVVVAIAPWPFGPVPHLYEKLAMLFVGRLVRPIDIFDLVFHGCGIPLVVAKAVREVVARRRV